MPFHWPCCQQNSLEYALPFITWNLRDNYSLLLRVLADERSAWEDLTASRCMYKIFRKINDVTKHSLETGNNHVSRSRSNRALLLNRTRASSGDGMIMDLCAAVHKSRSMFAACSKAVLWSIETSYVPSRVEMLRLMLLCVLDLHRNLRTFVFTAVDCTRLSFVSFWQLPATQKKAHWARWEPRGQC